MCLNPAPITDIVRRGPFARLNGLMVGRWVGLGETGLDVGERLGSTVGDGVWRISGDAVGTMTGLVVGNTSGLDVGIEVGFPVSTGDMVGKKVGSFVGEPVPGLEVHCDVVENARIGVGWLLEYPTNPNPS